MSARAPLCWLHCCVGRSGIVLYAIVLCAIALLFVCLRLPRELYAESPVLQLTIDCVEVLKCLTIHVLHIAFSFIICVHFRQ